MTVHEMFRSGSIEIAAPPEVVHDTVRQLERMGEWSPENIGGRWVSGDGSNAGDEFEGDNKRGDLTWTVVVTVLVSDPGRRFAFHTGTIDDPEVHWAYDIEATGDGTRLTETWDVERLPAPLEQFGDAYVTSRRDQVDSDIAETLANIKATIEG